MPYVCPRIDGSPSDSEDEGESARGCTRLHPTPDWSVSRRVGLRAPCSTPLFNYHRDYISQRRKFSSASNKGKCVLKSQGRKYIRSVVMVDALATKFLAENVGPRFNRVDVSSVLWNSGPTGVKDKLCRP